MTQFETSLSPNRRSFLASVAAAGTIGFLGFASSRRADALRIDQPTAQPPAGGGGESIRPFHFKASKEELADLRHRIAATRWPGKETVSDVTQGVQLATMQ